MKTNTFNKSGISVMHSFRNKLLRKSLAVWCALATLVTMCSPAFAGMDVLSNAELNQASANVGITTDLTTANIALNGGAVGVLDWNSFNVGVGETMNFGNGTFYNGVSGAGASTIAGAILGGAGANVYVFNGNGIIFNNTCSIDVGNFTAAAMNMNNLGALVADPTLAPAFDAASGAIVINGGDFAAAKLAFLGAAVDMAGAAKMNGEVAVGAGDKLTIDNVAGGTVTFELNDSATGDVNLMGEFADALAVKANGVLIREGAEVKAESVAVDANIIVALGDVIAEKGGEIKLIAKEALGFFETSSLTAEDGFIETSVTDADGRIILNGHVNVGDGEYLIDPANIHIVSGSSTYYIDRSGNTLDPDANGLALLFPVIETTSQIGASWLANELVNNDITIRTGGDGVAGDGDINVKASFSWTSGHTLTLDSDRDIIVENGASISGVNGGLYLDAAHQIKLDYGSISVKDLVFDPSNDKDYGTHVGSDSHSFTINAGTIWATGGDFEIKHNSSITATESFKVSIGDDFVLKSGSSITSPLIGIRAEDVAIDGTITSFGSAPDYDESGTEVGSHTVGGSVNIYAWDRLDLRKNAIITAGKSKNENASLDNKVVGQIVLIGGDGEDGSDRMLLEPGATLNAGEYEGEDGLMYGGLVETTSWDVGDIGWYVNGDEETIYEDEFDDYKEDHTETWWSINAAMAEEFDANVTGVHVYTPGNITIVHSAYCSEYNTISDSNAYDFGVGEAIISPNMEQKHKTYDGGDYDWTFGQMFVKDTWLDSYNHDERLDVTVKAQAGYKGSLSVEKNGTPTWSNWYDGDILVDADADISFDKQKTLTFETSRTGNYLLAPEAQLMNAYNNSGIDDWMGHNPSIEWECADGIGDIVVMGSIYSAKSSISFYADGNIVQLPYYYHDEPIESVIDASENNLTFEAGGAIILEGRTNAKNSYFASYDSVDVDFLGDASIVMVGNENDLGDINIEHVAGGVAIMNESDLIIKNKIVLNDEQAGLYDLALISDAGNVSINKELTNWGNITIMAAKAVKSSGADATITTAQRVKIGEDGEPMKDDDGNDIMEAGNLQVLALGGVIGLEGKLIIAGDTMLAATDDVVVNNVNNKFDGEVYGTGKALTVVADSKVIGNSTASAFTGLISIDATDDIQFCNGVDTTLGNIVSHKGNVYIYTTGDNKSIDLSKGYTVEASADKNVRIIASGDFTLDGTVDSYSDIFLGAGITNGEELDFDTVADIDDIVDAAAFDENKKGSFTLKENADLVLNKNYVKGVDIAAGKDVTINVSNKGALDVDTGHLEIYTENGDVAIKRDLLAQEYISVDAGNNTTIAKDVVLTAKNLVNQNNEDSTGLVDKSEGDAANGIYIAGRKGSVTINDGVKLLHGDKDTIGGDLEIVAGHNVTIKHTAETDALNKGGDVKIKSTGETQDSTVKIFNNIVADKDIILKGEGLGISGDSLEVTYSNELDANDEIVAEYGSLNAKTGKIDVDFKGDVCLNGALVKAGDFEYDIEQGTYELAKTDGAQNTITIHADGNVNTTSAAANGATRSTMMGAPGKITITGEGGVQILDNTYILTPDEIEMTAMDNDAQVKIEGNSVVKAIKDIKIESENGNVVIGHMINDPLATGPVVDQTVVAVGLNAKPAPAPEAETEGTDPEAEVVEEVAEQEAEEPVPGVDSSITIIAGKDVKVQNDVTLMATEAITIDADNKVIAQDTATIWAKGNGLDDDADTISIAAGTGVTIKGSVDDIASKSDLDGHKFVTVRAGDFAVPAVTVDDDGEVVFTTPDYAELDVRNLKISTETGAISIQDTAAVAATGDITISAGKNEDAACTIAIDNLSAVAAGGDLTLDADYEGIACSYARLIQVMNDSLAVAGGTLDITAFGDSDSSQFMVSNGAKVESLGDLTITSAGGVYVMNSSRLATSSGLFIAAGGQVAVSDNSVVKSTGDVTIYTDGSVGVGGGSYLMAGLVDFDLVMDEASGEPTINLTAIRADDEGNYANLTIEAAGSVIVASAGAVVASGEADIEAYGTAAADGIGVLQYSYLASGEDMYLYAKNDIEVGYWGNILTYGTLEAEVVGDILVGGYSTIKSSKDMSLTATEGDVVVGYPIFTAFDNMNRSTWDTSSIRAGENDAEGANITIGAGDDVAIIGYSDLMATGAIKINADDDIGVGGAATVWAKGKDVAEGEPTISFTAAADICVQGSEDCNYEDGVAKVCAGDFEAAYPFSELDFSEVDAKNLIMMTTDNGWIVVSDYAGVVASGDIQINSNGFDPTAVENYGIDIYNYGEVVAGANMLVSANDQLFIDDATLVAGGNLSVCGGSFADVQESLLVASEDLTVASTYGVDVINTLMTTDGDIYISVFDGDVNVTDGSVVDAAGEVEVDAAAGNVLIDVAGDFANGDGSFAQVEAGGTVNIAAEGNVAVEMVGDFTFNEENSISGGEGVALKIDGVLAQSFEELFEESLDSENVTLHIGSQEKDENGNVIPLLLGPNVKTIEITTTEGAAVLSSDLGNPFPKVKGNDSGTVVFVDGRVAGGDSALFSELQNLEGMLLVYPTIDMPGFEVEKGAFNEGAGSIDESAIKVDGAKKQASVEGAKDITLAMK